MYGFLGCIVATDEMMSDCEKRNPDPVGPYLEKILIHFRSVPLLDPRKKNIMSVLTHPSIQGKAAVHTTNVRANLCQMAGSVRSRHNGPARR